MALNRYPVEVFWSDEDEGYIASVPDLPGCSAFGESAAEALSEVDGAIEAWLEAAKAAGHVIPMPSRPADKQIFSGKTLLRMPTSLHAAVARQAEIENTSLNGYIVFALTAFVEHRASARKMPGVVDLYALAVSLPSGAIRATTNVPPVYPILDQLRWETKPSLPATPILGTITDVRSMSWPK